MRIYRSAMLLATLMCISTLLLTACGDNTDYASQRGISWEGKELTITLGENKDTGCNWTTKSQDDSVIDYSIHRSFKLVDKAVKEGKVYGTLSAGFEGKGAGTTQIICTTPCDWEGSGSGYTYIVTVTVNEDGTIESAEGEEAESVPAEAAEENAAVAGTLEEYFAANPGELEDMIKDINSDESIQGTLTVDLEVKDNTLSYIYNFIETFPDEKLEEIRPELKSRMESEVKESMEGTINSIEKAYGVDGVRLYMEYRNGDGATIYGTTYE